MEPETDSSFSSLSRRERQIMDIIYEHGSATASQVQEALPDPPTYSAVRSVLSLLTQKGVLKHHKVGASYVYKPTVAREKAKISALVQVVKIFFQNSAEEAVSALIHSQETKLSNEELDRLGELIDKARERERSDSQIL